GLGRPEGGREGPPREGQGRVLIPAPGWPRNRTPAGGVRQGGTGRRSRRARTEEAGHGQTVDASGGGGRGDAVGGGPGNGEGRVPRGADQRLGLDLRSRIEGPDPVRLAW